MFIIFALLASLNFGSAQDYGEYNEYQVFSDGENTSRHWGFAFIPQFIYLQMEEDNQPTDTTALDRDETYTIYDLKLGHVFRNGLYAGMIYSGETQKSGTSTGTYTGTRTSIGLSGGFLHKGWSFFLHYYLFSRQEIEFASATHDEYSKGTGLQAEVGYHFTINRWFSVGPMLVYKSWDYDEAENATTNVDAGGSMKHTFVTPMVSLLFTLYR